MKTAHGGVVGNMNFLWKVESTDEYHETSMAKVELPKFHTRQMRADFLVKYQRLANLGEIYRELPGDNSAAASEGEKKQRNRITEFLSSYDSDDVITDLRKLNGNPGSSKYDDFWAEVNQLFTEYEGSVHERRQGSYFTYRLQ